MIHYTLNTGHSRHSPRAEVADKIIEICMPLLSPGRHTIPGQPDTIQIQTGDTTDFFSASVLMIRGTGAGRESRAIASVTVCDDLDVSRHLWPALERDYLDLTDSGPLAACDFVSPRQPDSLPWCAVILAQGIAGRPEMEWLGDFERCLAWAWLERTRPNSN